MGKSMVTLGKAREFHGPPGWGTFSPISMIQCNLGQVTSSPFLFISVTSGFDQIFSQSFAFQDLGSHDIGVVP